jgi:hypothetical protein
MPEIKRRMSLIIDVLPSHEDKEAKKFELDLSTLSKR